MGISVCVASGKGGSGKSTLTVNLGIALSQMGISTLIVDGDFEGASFGLIMGIDPGTPSIHDCLSGRMSCEDAIVEVYGVKVLVGGIKIEQLVDVSLDAFPSILDELSEKFDVVLVDSPVGLGSDSVTVISSSQSVILVITPDINSVTNALKTLALAKKLGTAVLGFIINRKSGKFDIPSDKIADLLKLKLIGEIREEDRVKQALNESEPLIVSNPSCEFSQEIKRIANKLIGSP
jgi:septum site-determining protein MinD